MNRLAAIALGLFALLFSGCSMPTGAMKYDRTGSPEVLLPDGRGFYAGGRGGGLNTSEWYDPVTRAFVDGPEMKADRSCPAAVLLKNGKVLVAGGDDVTFARIFGFKVVSTTELYDPTSNSFAAGPTMIEPLHCSTAVLLRDGKVLIVGGLRQLSAGVEGVRNAEIYDPQTSSITAGPEMNVPRGDGTIAILLPTGAVLIAGGLGNWTIVDGLAIDDRIEIYDHVTNKFALGPKMTFGNGATRAALLPNGKVLITSRATRTSKEETMLYDPVNNSLAPEPTLSH